MSAIQLPSPPPPHMFIFDSNGMIRKRVSREKESSPDCLHFAPTRHLSLMADLRAAQVFDWMRLGEIFMAG